MSEWTVRRCEQCGKATPENGGFCCNCGAGASSYPAKAKDQRCEKCGEDYLNYLLECPFCGHGWDEPVHKSDTSLSLLVIDLGDSCVVKVERAVNTLVNTGDGEGLLLDNGVSVVHKPFTVLKREMLWDEKPPVPRIERENSDYRLFAANPHHDKGIGMFPSEYKALCELAGKELPIYEPKKGKWERLPSTSEYLGDPLESVGIKVWRYTR